MGIRTYLYGSRHQRHTAFIIVLAMTTNFRSIQFTWNARSKSDSWWSNTLHISAFMSFLRLHYIVDVSVCVCLFSRSWYVIIECHHKIYPTKRRKKINIMLHKFGVECVHIHISISRYLFYFFFVWIVRIFLGFQMRYSILRFQFWYVTKTRLKGNVVTYPNAMFM